MSKSIFKLVVINYLRLLSYIKLKYRFKGKIIAVAGCYGKSSAITMIESIFQNEHKIHTSNRNGKGLNSETGTTFVILNIEPKTYSIADWLNYLFIGTKTLLKNIDQNFLVLELGVDKPKDMKYLTSFIKPNAGILINSNNSHSVYFQELQKSTYKSFEELIAFENGYIFEASKDSIFYNLDDPEVVRQTSRFKGDKRNTFGFSSSNESKIKECKTSLSGTKLKVEYKGKLCDINHKEPLLEEYKDTIEMAVKISEFYNIKPESFIRGIESFELPPSRCSLFDGVNGSNILDSSYNSAYVPASSAIKLTNEISKGRNVAVLGDMRELGVLTEKEHRKLAHIAKEYLDIVITVGPAMKEFFADEFQKIKSDNQELYVFDKTKDALKFLTENNSKFIKKDDLILVKGSQNTLLLEIIVEALLKDKSEKNRLCRRGELYDKERQKLLA